MPIPHIPRSLGRDDVFIVRTLDGSDTLFNKSLGVTYHSIKGAVSESRHVFIQNGLNSFRTKASIRILEFGFGSGLNALLSILFSIRYRKEVHYTGIESFPVDLLTVSQLNYPDYLLAADYRNLFMNMHIRDAFDFDHFHFRKYNDLNEAIKIKEYDVIFFDAFAPEIQPESWSPDIFELLYNLLAVDGILVTYCAQGEVRRRMIKAGFSVDRLPGAPGKRHMLRGVKRSIDS